MIIKHRQDVYVRRCRWQYAAFYRNVHTWHFSRSSSLSPPIVFVQPEFVLMGQQCNTENFYSSAPHCKILRVVNKGLSNHPAVFIHWIHTNAVDTMACLRHSTPRNTNRMWMADIKYFTGKLEASNIWLNSTLSSFDSSVSGGYLFNPLLVLSWNIWNKCRHQPMQVTANHFSTCLQNSFINEWRDTRRSIIQGIVLEGNFAVAAQCCSGSNILLKLNLG